MKRSVWLVAAISFAALPALAGPPAGHGAAGAGFCPPGLAKKAVPCVPPGLARKGVTSWQPGADYQPGDVVSPAQVTQTINTPGQYNLPPLPPGERYVVVNGQLLKVNDRTYAVIQVFQGLKTLLK